jgi:hypothetical protein
VAAVATAVMDSSGSHFIKLWATDRDKGGNIAMFYACIDKKKKAIVKLFPEPPAELLTRQCITQENAIRNINLVMYTTDEYVTVLLDFEIQPNYILRVHVTEEGVYTVIYDLLE